jgi:hypothetical protein
VVNRACQLGLMAANASCFSGTPQAIRTRILLAGVCIQTEAETVAFRRTPLQSKSTRCQASGIRCQVKKSIVAIQRLARSEAVKRSQNNEVSYARYQVSGKAVSPVRLPAASISGVTRHSSPVTVPSVRDKSGYSALKRLIAGRSRRTSALIRGKSG